MVVSAILNKSLEKWLFLAGLLSGVFMAKSLYFGT